MFQTFSIERGLTDPSLLIFVASVSYVGLLRSVSAKKKQICKVLARNQSILQLVIKIKKKILISARFFYSLAVQEKKIAKAASLTGFEISIESLVDENFLVTFSATLVLSRNETQSVVQTDLTSAFFLLSAGSRTRVYSFFVESRSCFSFIWM